MPIMVHGLQSIDCSSDGSGTGRVLHDLIQLWGRYRASLTAHCKLLETEATLKENHMRMLMFMCFDGS